MSSNYETLYGVGLLDDLHNYFPALLYDSSGFGSVRDVLTYIQTQARNRFDLFSYGLREYQNIHPPRTASENSYRRVVRTSFAGMPSPMPNPLSTLLRPSNATIPSVNSIVIDESEETTQPTVFQSTLSTNAQTVPSIHVELNRLLQQRDEDDEEVEEEASNQIENALSRTLLSLLNIPATGLTRTYDIDAFGAILARPHGMDQFLQPVVVRPTANQIAENTTLGNLVSDTDHACAICQDNLTAEQEGRKLNACGHWFHKNCIDTWLSGNVHCPVCRHDIREPLEQSSAQEEQ